MKKEKRIEYMFMMLGSIVGRLLHLKRTCPKCKMEQIVPLARKHETISCKFCGAKIPPPGK
jgi:ribosomal protein S27E